MQQQISLSNHSNSVAIAISTPEIYPGYFAGKIAPGHYNPSGMGPKFTVVYIKHG